VVGFGRVGRLSIGPGIAVGVSGGRAAVSGLRLLFAGVGGWWLLTTVSVGIN